MRRHNLLHVCTSCNAIKGDQDVADPTQTLLLTSVAVEDDGTLIGTTPQAAELSELLHEPPLRLRVRRRLLMAAIRVFREREPELYRRWMSFPDDLSDLSRLRPPGCNSRPQGLAQSPLRAMPTRLISRDLLGTANWIGRNRPETAAASASPTRRAVSWPGRIVCGPCPGHPGTSSPRPDPGQA